MEHLGNKILDSIKTDKSLLLQLKSIFVDNSNFDIAADIRRMEKELYPSDDIDDKLIYEAKLISTLLKMVNLNIPTKQSFIILLTIDKYNKREGNFDLKDAVKINLKANELFG